MGGRASPHVCVVRAFTEKRDRIKQRCILSVYVNVSMCILRDMYGCCILFLLTYSSSSPFPLLRVDYACIPQPSCEIPLQESLIPKEVSRRGSFFGSFMSVSKSFQNVGSATGSKDDADLVEALQALGQTVTPDDDETKGEPQRRPIQRRNTADHRHISANSQGSSAKHWLGEAVKVSVASSCLSTPKKRGSVGRVALIIDAR